MPGSDDPGLIQQSTTHSVLLSCRQSKNTSPYLLNGVLSAIRDSDQMLDSHSRFSPAWQDSWARRYTVTPVIQDEVSADNEGVKSEAFPGKGLYAKWIRLALVEREIIPGRLARSRARRYID